MQGWHRFCFISAQNVPTMLNQMWTESDRCMWHMAKQTTLAAAVCDFDLRVLACFFYRF